MQEQEQKEQRQLATVELLGALTYAQLRSFDTTARAVSLAPDARRADHLADLAVAEHARYVALRDHLKTLTDLPAPVLDRHKDPVDRYFGGIPFDDWAGACAFFAVGLPVAADFTREVAPALDPPTAEVVLLALADRDRFEGWAHDELHRIIDEGDGATDHVRSLVADILGRALTQFQQAIGETDALEVLLDGADDDDHVRRLAVNVLEGHRRRMFALGLDDLA